MTNGHQANPGGEGSAKKTADAQAIKARVNRMIERELARCRTQMGDEAWQRHAEWVTSNVIAGAKEWLSNQAMKGELL